MAAKCISISELCSGLLTIAFSVANSALFTKLFVIVNLEIMYRVTLMLQRITNN